MSSLMTPMAEKGRGWEMATAGKGIAFTQFTGTRSIEFQGDAGWGVQSEARASRQERARQNARNAVLPPVLR